MPIIYVHGVAVREENSWKQREPFLRHYISPILNSENPERVAILPVYWGSSGVKFYWEGQSRPRTALLGHGSSDDESVIRKATLLASLGQTLGDLPVESVVNAKDDSDLQTFGPEGNAVPAAASQRLFELSENELSDLFTTLFSEQLAKNQQLAQILIAIDIVAHNPKTKEILKNLPTVEAEINELQSLIKDQFEEQINLKEQGFFHDIKERLSEVLSRAAQTPGFIVSRLLGELRPKINNGVTVFFGDVFEYLAHRLERVTTRAVAETLLEELVESHMLQSTTVPSANLSNLKPGPIPGKLLTALKKAHDLQKFANEQEGRDEPIVVITHSMGGQIMYDTVTAFLPNLDEYKNIRIDFWCAVASQVGLFEEMKLFLASNLQYSKANNNKAPFPDRHYLGSWWNIWDVNDVLSFTAEPIFEGIDDEFYDSGCSTLNAHGGYFERPSFYRKLADKLTQSKTKNWYRPI